MDTVMPEEQLRAVFDRITREVTASTAGIQLEKRELPLEQELCTVHIGFRKGFHSSLSLQVDTAMLTRMTQTMLKKKNVTPQDVEDAGKEYFNVLCGHIARALYQATRVASRFTVPSFYRGSFVPEGQKEQFRLTYSGDRNETAQLIHHIPSKPEQG